MITTQPDRILLQRQITQYAPLLTGALLDVGSGRSRRYEKACVNVTSYKTMDVDERGQPDVIGSAEAIPFPDATFESVLCTQVLEHLPHPVKAIEEMYRVLKPGGLCLLTAPQWNELHEEPHDYFRYTKYGLQTLFEDAGFTVEALDQRGKYFSERAQQKIRYWINTWRPYERKWTMIFVGPLSHLLSRYAVWRDARTKNPAADAHAIGWLILGRKQEK